LFQVKAATRSLSLSLFNMFLFLAAFSYAQQVLLNSMDCFQLSTSNQCKEYSGKKKEEIEANFKVTNLKYSHPKDFWILKSKSYSNVAQFDSWGESLLSLSLSNALLFLSSKKGIEVKRKNYKRTKALMNFNSN
jgi:hypothetical protein